MKVDNVILSNSSYCLLLHSSRHLECLQIIIDRTRLIIEFIKIFTKFKINAKYVFIFTISLHLTHSSQLSPSEKLLTVHILLYVKKNLRGLKISLVIFKDLIEM